MADVALAFPLAIKYVKGHGLISEAQAGLDDDCLNSSEWSEPEEEQVVERKFRLLVMDWTTFVFPGIGYGDLIGFSIVADDEPGGGSVKPAADPAGTLGMNFGEYEEGVFKKVLCIRFFFSQEHDLLPRYRMMAGTTIGLNDNAEE